MGFPRPTVVWNLPPAEPEAQTTRAHPGRARRSLNGAAFAHVASKGCAACTLNNARLLHPKMPATGPADAEIYIIAEAPGETEDEEGIQLIGKAGQVLRRALPNHIEKAARFDNIIDCRPPSNRQPTPLEIACCRPRQVADIEKVKPKLILAFGSVPLHWFTNEDKITAWRGRLIPVRVGKHKCWLAPIYHPSFVARSRHQAKGALVEESFERDLRNAIAAYERGLPEPHVEDPADAPLGVECLTSFDKVLAALQHARRWKDFAIDIETNGLRPYRADPKILTVAISNYDRTFAWPMQHKEATWSKAQRDKIGAALVELMHGRSPIAHNSKMEQEWLSYFYGDDVVFGSVDWQDTMAQAYVLDEREGTKSLGSCTMSRIGFNVKSLSRVAVERLEHEPLSRVLEYNAYDAKYTYLLYYVQQDLIEQDGAAEAYRTANSRAGPLAIAQRRGVVPNPDAVLELNREYQSRQREKELEIQKDPDVQRFVKAHGKFNPASNKDLVGLFHKQLGCKECEVKDKKNRDKVRISTDEAVLSQIERLPIARHILEWRGIKKMRSTYILPLTPDGGLIWHDKLVHADFHHLLTSTSRLSCEGPNLQNFPIRTPEAKRIRSVIRAPEGQWMVSDDFGQIEARVIAMASRDKTLVDALWTGYDIHYEWAQKLASDYPQVVGGKRFLADKDVMKNFRSIVKNAWVFPLFFGSAVQSVAENLKMPLAKVTRRYDEFWDTFEGVLRWQERLQKDYRRLGYVAKLTGGRRHAPLGLNEIINSPIQGTAADIVNDAFCRLSRRAYEEGTAYLQPVLQVHDDLTFYVPDANLESAMEVIAREMVRVDTMPFINVPLTVEVLVGSDWSNKEEVAKFSSTDFGHRRKHAKE